MTGKLQAKIAGIPLLSKVPAHWSVNTIKRGFEVTLGKMLQPEKKLDTEVFAPYLRSVNVRWGSVDVSDVQMMWFSPNELQQLNLNNGDLVVCEGGDAGRASIWRDELESCSFQNSVNRVRSAGGNDPRYLMYWLASIKESGYVEIVCNKATIAHLTKDKLSNLPMPYPPPKEQFAIAAYLDSETARIDALIKEKGALLSLLEEAQHGAVERAVLPNEGARLQPLKRFVEALSTGPFGSALHSSDYVTGGISVINPTHIVNGQVVADDDVSISEEMASALAVYRLQPGDVVIGRRGEMGRCAVVPAGSSNWLCGTGSLMLTPNRSKVLSDYLQLVISSRASRDWLSLESVGSTMENLNGEILGRLPCFIPDIEQQIQRLTDCKREVDGLSSLKSHVLAEMSLLTELRSSTVTDAVLGRIDVQKHARH